jgi:hypothetical protein
MVHYLNVLRAWLDDTVYMSTGAALAVAFLFLFLDATLLASGACLSEYRPSA